MRLNQSSRCIRMYNIGCVNGHYRVKYVSYVYKLMTTINKEEFSKQEEMLMETITAKTPWKDHLGELPFTL